MKPSSRPVDDDEPKAFHHVTGLLARPLTVKKEAGKGLLLAARGEASSYRLDTPSHSRSTQGSAWQPGTWGESCRQPGTWGESCRQPGT